MDYSTDEKLRITASLVASVDRTQLMIDQVLASPPNEWTQAMLIRLRADEQEGVLLLEKLGRTKALKGEPWSESLMPVTDGVES